MGLYGKEERQKLESSLQRTEYQQSIDPVDLMNKAFLATLKERYHLDALKQIRDSKLFQGKSLDHMNKMIKEMEATQKQRMTWKKNIQNNPTTNIGRSIIILGNIKMRVNRLNPVQKATYFLNKSKVGTNEECTVTVKTATYQ